VRVEIQCVFIFFGFFIQSVINQMKFNLTVLFSHLKILVDDGFLQLEGKTVVVLHHGQHF
jgi:hypothetical protein